jgi:hypothetical protein
MSNTVKAKSWFTRFRPAYTLHGGPPHVEEEVMAASQAIKEGDPVTKASNVVSKGASSSGTIYGVAQETKTTTADDEKYKIRVAVADRQTVFCGQADAKTEDIDDLAECDIVASGTKWLIDIGSSVEDVVMVIKHVPDDDQTDDTDPGRLYFIWKRSSWDGLVAAQG